MECMTNVIKAEPKPETAAARLWWEAVSRGLAVLGRREPPFQPENRGSTGSRSGFRKNRTVQEEGDLHKREERGGWRRKKQEKSIIYFVIFLLITTKNSQEMKKRIERCNLKHLLET